MCEREEAARSPRFGRRRVVVAASGQGEGGVYPLVSDERRALHVSLERIKVNGV